MYGIFALHKFPSIVHCIPNIWMSKGCISAHVSRIVCPFIFRKAELCSEGTVMVPSPLRALRGSELSFGLKAWRKCSYLAQFIEVMLDFPYISQTYASNFDTTEAARVSDIPSYEKVST